MNTGQTDDRIAVVLLHGIGEQRPMATLRGFVRGVFDESGRSKPDRLSELFEVRRLDVKAGGFKVDCYELYWAHHMSASTLTHIAKWLLRLFSTPGAELEKMARHLDESLYAKTRAAVSRSPSPTSGRHGFGELRAEVLASGGDSLAKLSSQENEGMVGLRNLRSTIELHSRRGKDFLDAIPKRPDFWRAPAKVSAISSDYLQRLSKVRWSRTIAITKPMSMRAGEKPVQSIHLINSYDGFPGEGICLGAGNHQAADDARHRLYRLHRGIFQRLHALDIRIADGKGGMGRRGRFSWFFPLLAAFGRSWESRLSWRHPNLAMDSHPSRNRSERFDTRRLRTPLRFNWSPSKLG